MGDFYFVLDIYTFSLVHPKTCVQLLYNASINVSIFISNNILFTQLLIPQIGSLQSKNKNTIQDRYF